MERLENKFQCSGICAEQNYFYFFRDIQSTSRPLGECVKYACNLAKDYFNYGVYPALTGGIFGILLLIIQIFNYNYALSDPL